MLPSPEVIKWVKVWKNINNKFTIFALHFSSDPVKDPDRDWKEWYKKEREWMPKAKWNKEYELDFESKAGQLIFGSEYCDFSPWIHFIDSFNVKWELILSLDFGQSNPTVWLVGCYDKNGVLYIIDEYYKPAIPSVSSREMFDQFAPHFKREVPEWKKYDYDLKRDIADDTFQIKVIDPTTRSKNRTKVKEWEEIQYSVKEDFYDHGWDFELWNNDWDSSITRLREYFQLDGNWKAHLYIFKDKCPHLCWELQRYKYREQTESQERVSNKSERPTKKHDDSVDSLRYLIMTRPNKPMAPKQELNVIQRDIQRLLKPVNLSASWDVDG